MAAVTFKYYSETYGGGLDEAAFGEFLPVAESHVKWRRVETEIRRTRALGDYDKTARESQRHGVEKSPP